MKGLYVVVPICLYMLGILVISSERYTWINVVTNEEMFGLSIYLLMGYILWVVLVWFSNISNENKENWISFPSVIIGSLGVHIKLMEAAMSDVLLNCGLINLKCQWTYQEKLSKVKELIKIDGCQTVDKIRLEKIARESNSIMEVKESVESYLVELNTVSISNWDIFVSYCGKVMDIAIVGAPYLLTITAVAVTIMFVTQGANEVVHQIGAFIRGLNPFGRGNGNGNVVNIEAFRDQCVNVFLNIRDNLIRMDFNLERIGGQLNRDEALFRQIIGNQAGDIELLRNDLMNLRLNHEEMAQNLADLMVFLMENQ